MSSIPHAPCAACKCRRQKCTQECIFAPYFPPDNPQKFESIHRVFGASNVSKLLQELPPQHRADAVFSLTYEAQCRIRDPIYGCIALISFFQNRLALLKSELELAKNELATCITYIQQQQNDGGARIQPLNSCYEQGETSNQILQTNAHLQQQSLLQSNLQYFPQQRSHVPLINPQVQLMEETELRQQQMLMQQPQPQPYPQLRSNVSMLTNQIPLMNPHQRGENMVMPQGEQFQSNLQFYPQQRGENEPRHDHGSLLRERVLSNPQYDHLAETS